MRPLSAGDIVDEAIGLYRRNFRLFLSIGAVALVPAGVIQLILALLADEAGPSLLTISSALWWVLSVVVAGVAYILVFATMAIAASERWLERPMSVSDAYRRMFNRIGALASLVLIYALTIAILTATIIGFPVAIYLAVAWLLSIQILLVEGSGLRNALARSRRLVAGHWWRVIGIVVLLAIIQGIISAFFTLPATIFGFGSLFSDPTGTDASPLVVALDAIGSTAGQIVAGPIAYCAYILLYYDLRVRKEGLDIELAARSLGLIDAPAAGSQA
ncbi:MAG TPA: hypothetical protein VFV93_00065 [Thermomicrobiales bacterium]|nr:hypothetical protein [Thermomicrobiales bacterium]